MTKRIKRIGVLGGSSDQATAVYYARLNKAANERLGGWNTAELILTSMNFAFSEECVRKGLWAEMGAYLADRAKALELGGADLFLCVSNTLHRVADEFCAGVRMPFLHIADPTAAAIRARGLGRVGLLGTKPVMSADYMKQRYRQQGVEAIVPTEEEQDLVDRIIFDELCKGVFSAEAKAAYLKIIDAMADRGAQGMILGCTEIPLLIAQEDRPTLPMFDTLALHVDAALEAALA